MEMQAAGTSFLPLEVTRSLRVQHTFITVAEEDNLSDNETSPRRRSSSVPCLWRPSMNDNEVGKRARSGTELASSESSHAYCDTSTEEGASVVCTDLDASDADALSEEVESAPWITGCVLAQMLLNKESLAEIAADEEYMLQSLPTVRSNRAAGQQRAKLNSQAKAWVPSSPSVTDATTTIPRVVTPPVAVPPPPQVPTAHLDKQFQSVIASGKAALEKTRIVSNVKVVEAVMGWRIVGTVNQTHFWRKEQLCAQVKEALLSAAENSQSVYVLGYAWNPFRATERGFTAVLCNCSDPIQACWGVLKYGQCQHSHARGRCPFQHPSQTLMLSVELVPEEP